MMRASWTRTVIALPRLVVQRSWDATPHHGQRIFSAGCLRDLPARPPWARTKSMASPSLDMACMSAEVKFKISPFGGLGHG